MDDMIEFVLEFVGEIFGDVLEGAFSNPKTPMWLKKLLALLVTLILCAVIALLVYVALMEGNPLFFRLLCGVGAAALVIVCVFLIYRATEKTRSKDQPS